MPVSRSRRRAGYDGHVAVRAALQRHGSLQGGARRNEDVECGRALDGQDRGQPLLGVHRPHAGRRRQRGLGSARASGVAGSDTCAGEVSADAAPR